MGLPVSRGTPSSYTALAGIGVTPPPGGGLTLITTGGTLVTRPPVIIGGNPPPPPPGGGVITSIQPPVRDESGLPPAVALPRTSIAPPPEYVTYPTSPVAVRSHFATGPALTDVLPQSSPMPVWALVAVAAAAAGYLLWPSVRRRR